MSSEQKVARVNDRGTGTCSQDGQVDVTLTQGSPNVFINNKAAGIIQITTGVASCGHDTVADNGSGSVFINNKAVHRVNDKGSIRPGNDYIVITGSENVFAGGDGSTTVIEGVKVFNDYTAPAASQVLRDTAGPRANNDEPDTDSPPGDPPPPPTEENNTPAPPTPPLPVDCSSITLPVDYSYRLSPNFILKQVCLTTLSAHPIVPQHGLTPQQIICNLQAVVTNCLEPILAHYPGVHVNSGFRRGNGKSQHERGQALDLQWPGASYDEYWAKIHWIKDNIPYDQLLYEYGNTVWIHVSFNQAGNRPASASNKIMTMYNGHYTSGLKRYR